MRSLHIARLVSVPDNIAALRMAEDLGFVGIVTGRNSDGTTRVLMGLPGWEVYCRRARKAAVKAKARRRYRQAHGGRR